MNPSKGLARIRILATIAYTSKRYDWLKSQITINASNRLSTTITAAFPYQQIQEQNMSKFNTIQKPWGFEEVIELNEKYMVKRLTMWAGHRCSLQYHNLKRETIYVLSGVIKIITGSTQETLEEKLYRAGDAITIEPGVVHRMEGVEDSVYLEASTPEMDDVVRLVDDYQRAQK